QASFAFTVAEAETRFTENDEGPDVEHRTILEMKHLYDVCATPQGAYPQTISGLRSYAAALGQPQEWGGQARQPEEGGVIIVNPVEGGDVGSDQEERLQRFRDLTEKRRQDLRVKYPARK